MAKDNLKSRNAFGSFANIDSAINQGLIDAYDILFLDGNVEPKVGWVDKDGIVRIVDNKCVIVVNENTLPESGEIGKIYIHNSKLYFWNGTEFVSSTTECVDEAVVDTKISTAIQEVSSYVDEQIANAVTVVEF